MKSGLHAAVITAGLLVCGSAATAQTPAETIIAQDGLELPADREVIVREHVVREYVVREPTQSVIIDGGGTVRPGSVIPDYVRLRPFDNSSVPNLRRYGYFVSSDEKIVVVDPTTRQVVRILSAATTGSIAVAPEERTMIRDFVLRERRTPVVVPSGFTVSVGAILPRSVQVYAFPAPLGIPQYGYTVIGNRTLLVEPASRRVVQVIE